MKGKNDSLTASKNGSGRLGTYMKSHFRGSIIYKRVEMSITLELQFLETKMSCFSDRIAQITLERVYPEMGRCMK